MTDLLNELNKIRKLNRIQRISKEIKKEVAYIFQRYLKDFFPEMITVTKVVMAKDLSLAKIYISVFDTHKLFSEKDIISIIQKKASLTRKYLAKSVKLRKLPKIMFILDEGIIENSRLINLIRKVSSSNGYI